MNTEARDYEGLAAALSPTFNEEWEDEEEGYTISQILEYLSREWSVECAEGLRKDVCALLTPPVPDAECLAKLFISLGILVDPREHGVDPSDWLRHAARMAEAAIERGRADRIIERLVSGLHQRDLNVHEREAILRTRGLPVWRDATRCAVVKRKNEAWLYDSKRDIVDPVLDPLCLKRIFALAAAKFPELEAWRPVRPPTAPDCTECRGSGRLFDRTCRACAGTGWA